MTVLGFAAGVIAAVSFGLAAAYYAIARFSPHVGQHVRFFVDDDDVDMRLWYCSRCGESGRVEFDVVNSGGFLHEQRCSPPG